MGNNIKRDDISQDMVKFAELVGYDLFYKICEEYGGSQLYFPKASSLIRKARDREIREKHGMMNYIELGRLYGLTTNQVRNIVINANGDCTK